MPDFSNEELQVLAMGLDYMVRTEGNGLAQVGTQGIREGRAPQLAARFALANSALEKIEAHFKAPAEKPADPPAA